MFNWISVHLLLWIPLCYYKFYEARETRLFFLTIFLKIQNKMSNICKALMNENIFSHFDHSSHMQKDISTWNLFTFDKLLLTNFHHTYKITNF